MERPVPENFDLLHDAASLKRHVDQLAGEIEPWAAKVLEETGLPLLALCILRGGAFFFTDLLKACRISIEPAFCRARSYSSVENATQLGSVETTFIGTAFDGRSVLLVDDICDTGKTLAYLAADLPRRGAREVRSATLVFRDRSDSSFKPDWHAFTYGGNEWLVGYGMEDRNQYMNYPALYRLRPEAGKQ